MLQNDNNAEIENTRTSVFKYTCLYINTQPALLFCINISTVTWVRYDCQGLGLAVQYGAAILVFDAMQVFCIDHFGDESSFAA